MHHVSCNDFWFLCSFWGEYQISHSPHFGAIWTDFQTVYSGPEVNKLERGLKPTETYVSKDSGGLGVWCVWTTYSWRCQCGGRQWERQKSNIFRWLAKQQLCTYCTTDDVKMPNFTFVENANKWQSTFFLFELRYYSKEFNSKGIRTRVSYRVQFSRGFSRLPFTESLLAGQSFKEREHTRIVCPLAVADLDLQIRGERSSRPWIKGGGAVSKNVV